MFLMISKPFKSTIMIKCILKQLFLLCFLYVSATAQMTFVHPGSFSSKAELDFVNNHGKDFANPGSRPEDHLLQALFYKYVVELFTHEVARIDL